MGNAVWMRMKLQTPLGAGGPTGAEQEEEEEKEEEEEEENGHDEESWNV